MLICLLVPMVVSCSGNAEDSTTLPDTVTTPAVDGVDTSRTTDHIPTDTYNGATFTVLVGANVTGVPHIFEPQNLEDSVDAAINERNLKIEKQYDIEINEVYQFKHTYGASSGSAYDKILVAVESQEPLYNMAVGATYDCATMAKLGWLADLRDYGCIDLNKAWWDQAANRQLTINGRTFFTAGDISYLDDHYTYAMIFNKDYAEQLNINDIYQLVENKEWTYDKFYQYCKDATNTANSVGYSEDAKYGFLGYKDTIYMSFASVGSTVAHVNDAGELELSLKSEKNFKVIKDWTEFGQDSSFINWQTFSLSWSDVYRKNQSLFFGATMAGIYAIRNTEAKYGIIPFPMFDTEQDVYHSGMSPNHISLFCIPNIGNDKHIAMTAALVEAFGAGSDKVVEAFYTKNLEGKIVQDNESVETLKLVFADKIFDLGYYFSIGNYRSTIAQMFVNGDATFSSSYDKTELDAKLTVAQINKAFKDLDFSITQ